MAFYSDTRATGITLADRFVALRDRLADAAAKRRVYRTTVSELDALSTRELADLGLSRSMIKGIAYEAAYGSN